MLHLLFLRRSKWARFSCLAYLWIHSFYIFFPALTFKNSSQIYSIECHYLKISHVVKYKGLWFLLYFIWNNNASCKDDNNSLVVSVPCLYTLVHN